MFEKFWLEVVVGGVVASVVVAILVSTWRFERNSMTYRKYLKREEERQNREDALLARQEQLLERIEALVDQVVAEKTAMLESGWLLETELPRAVGRTVF